MYALEQTHVTNNTWDFSTFTIRPGSHLGLRSRLDLAPKRLESRLSHHLMTRLDLNFLWLKSATWTPLFYRNFRWKCPPPSRTQRFRPISAHSASTVVASDKSSISTNRKSTTRFSTSHRWTMYITPKYLRGWLNTRIFTFGIAFYMFAAGSRRHLKLGIWVKHSKSQL